jgi:hypothetical protein
MRQPKQQYRASCLTLDAATGEVMAGEAFEVLTPATGRPHHVQHAGSSDPPPLRDSRIDAFVVAVVMVLDFDGFDGTTCHALRKKFAICRV